MDQKTFFQKGKEKMTGFIIKAVGGIYQVFCHEDHQSYSCKVLGKFRNQNITPLCGDEVIFSYQEETNFSWIHEILPRKNELVRPPCSNLDLALIVMSTIKPDFDSYLVDKLIVCATLQNIEPIILISKCEYMYDELNSLCENYRNAGYQVICFSSHEMKNIDLIQQLIFQKRVVLCGQSAVGKSSLINVLSKDQKKSIGSYSEKLGRGKHETREVEFLNIQGAFIADTPGFSRLDVKVEATTLARLFLDFEKYAKNCRYSSCLHKDEPGCAVKKALQEGKINERRYYNYLHLLQEIKEGKKVWRKK